MKKLFSVEKINKKIAEYMESQIEWDENDKAPLGEVLGPLIKDYTKSLDRLTPVVENLMMGFIAAVGYSKMHMTDKKRIEYKPYIEWVGREPELVDGFYETPAEALALAVYTVLENK